MSGSDISEVVWVLICFFTNNALLKDAISSLTLNEDIWRNTRRKSKYYLEYQFVLEKRAQWLFLCESFFFCLVTCILMKVLTDFCILKPKKANNQLTNIGTLLLLMHSNISTTSIILIESVTQICTNIRAAFL